MKLIVLTIDLIRGTIGDKGISVVGHGEIGAGLRPNVVGFRRMDMGIIPAGRGQDVVVIRGISHLSADVDLAPIDRGNGGSVNRRGCGKSAGWDRKTGWPAESNCGFPSQPQIRA